MSAFSKVLRTLLNSYFNTYGGGPYEAVEELAAAIDDASTFRIPRLPWDAHFMLEAAVAATRSTCDRGPELYFDPGRHGVGSVFVRDKRIIAGGFNGSPPGQPHCDVFECYVCDATFEGVAREGLEDCGRCPCCGTPNALSGGHLIRDGHCVRTLHAEENALLQCALDGTSPAGATVYTTASPCWDCSKRLVRAGVARVVYGADYESRYALSKDAGKLLQDASIKVERLDLREYLRVGGKFSRCKGCDRPMTVTVAACPHGYCKSCCRAGECPECERLIKERDDE